MKGLEFEITGVRAKKYAASPTILFDMKILAGRRIEALVLRAQLRIEPQWRPYDPRERALLNDLFGTPDRWNTTLRSLSWADVPVVVTGFTKETRAVIEVPCTYDFDLAATRFLTALGGGEIPLRFLFSGAIFSAGASGFSTERVAWSSEAAFRMPVSIWHEAMRGCYGDDVLLRISRETFEHLQTVRALSGATTWDAVIAAKHPPVEKGTV